MFGLGNPADCLQGQSEIVEHPRVRRRMQKRVLEVAYGPHEIAAMPRQIPDIEVCFGVVRMETEKLAPHGFRIGHCAALNRSLAP